MRSIITVVDIIECISWLIKVTDNNNALWKPEIRCIVQTMECNLIRVSVVSRQCELY